MAPHQSSSITCLSTEEHHENISNHLVHYFGCLPITGAKGKIGRDEFKNEASDDIREDIEREIKRVDFLRSTLANDQLDSHLVKTLEKSLGEWRSTIRRKKNAPAPEARPEREEIAKSSGDNYDLLWDVKVPIIHYNNGEGKPLDDKRIWGTFPNQKTNLKYLLTDDNIPPDTPKGKKLLQQNEASKGITYFHIPYNNMTWAESSIARYFNEDGQGVKPKTDSILKYRYWYGQLHGDQKRSPAHSRHLHAIWAAMTSEPDKPDTIQKDMVLFMPYLHWDTSRKRQQFAKEINRIIRQDERSAKEEVKEKKKTRQEQREQQTGQPTPQPERQETQQELDKQPFWNFSRRSGQGDNNLQADERGRLLISNKLGQYLLDATRLYEGMTNYRDKTVFREYLTREPPLHPRRTLDQAYYWILKSTKKRDTDQVVYRGTTPRSSDFHEYDREKNCWPDHKYLKGDDCDFCRRNIQKLSRVVMVDQLWMWILDGNTIITCFPRRYGTNKQDMSGVHKSIRLRLRDDKSLRVRSVYDLALIIIDECCDTFFDRTKKVDRQPQVLEEFSTAIGDVMHKQTSAFERLWHWTYEAKLVYRSRGSDTSELHVPLLDINPEGRLEREIKDIIEELDIMIHITKTQKDILEKFVTYATNKLDLPKPEPEENAKNRMWFKHNADEHLANITERIEKMKELRETAENTATSVKDLLSLKQQQASVVQAWQAAKQSEETVKQGRSIMVFTIVTIIFLPLSFMSSVFGMNNVEFSDDSWAVKDEFAFMFPISIAVIFISSILAFNTWIRSFIWYYGNVPLVARLIRTPLYNVWLDKAKSIKTMNRDGYKTVNERKAKVMQERLQKRYEAEHGNTKTQSKTVDGGEPTSTPSAPPDATSSEADSRHTGFDWGSLLRFRSRKGASSDIESASHSDPPSQ